MGFFGTGQNLTRGTFNIGTNCSIVMIDNDTNQPIDLGLVTEFSAEPEQSTITSKPISNKGYNQYVEEFNGWKGTITVDRRNGALDAVQALQELNYHNGLAQKYFTIVVTVQNVNYDGTTDVLQFNFCTVKIGGGRYSKDSAVPVSITFSTQDRVKLS